MIVQGVGGQLIEVNFVVVKDTSNGVLWTPSGPVDPWASAPVSMLPKPPPPPSPFVRHYNYPIHLELLDSVNPFTRALDAFETGKAGWTQNSYHVYLTKEEEEYEDVTN